MAGGYPYCKHRFTTVDERDVLDKIRWPTPCVRCENETLRAEVERLKASLIEANQYADRLRDVELEAMRLERDAAEQVAEERRERAKQAERERDEARTRLVRGPLSDGMAAPLIARAALKRGAT